MAETIKNKEQDVFTKKDYRGILYVLAFKYFSLVILFIIIIIFIVAYQFLLKPKYNSIISGQEISNKKQEYLDKMKYFNQLKSLRRVYDSIDIKNLEKVNSIINNKNNQEEIFREIEYIANSNGLTLNNLKVSALDNSSTKLNNIIGSKYKNKLFDKIEIVKVDFDLLNVSYDNLISVLKTIENNLRIMDVISIDFAADVNQASLELYTYQLKQ